MISQFSGNVDLEVFCDLVDGSIRLDAKCSKFFMTFVFWEKLHRADADDMDWAVSGKKARSSD
ncbi:hypothetical protein AT244_07910 [Bartonella henselae]|nr:hypothetical protein AT244_07910 [Bartonella henselae]